MAQVKFEKDITGSWIPFTDIIGEVNYTGYYPFQNRGFDTLIAQEIEQETPTLPAANNSDGYLVLPNKTWTWIPEEGKNLYIRAFNSGCSVNVTFEK